MAGWAVRTERYGVRLFPRGVGAGVVEAAGLIVDGGAQLGSAGARAKVLPVVRAPFASLAPILEVRQLFCRQDSEYPPVTAQPHGFLG